jgi:hypothetical protein
VFSVVGALIVVAGLIDLIWSQVDFPIPEEFASGAQRWSVATNSIFVMGIGVLICVAAEILKEMTRRSAQPRTPAEVEELWETWSQPEAS